VELFFSEGWVPAFLVLVLNEAWFSAGRSLSRKPIGYSWRYWLTFGVRRNKVANTALKIRIGT
jgi:hypothetical protein